MKNNTTYQDLISVIVSTYNWPAALRLVLLALNNQTDRNFEVIIVDDGSTEDTEKMIDAFKPTAKFPLKHLWQEDEGFRLSRARNLGIKNAKGAYIIFLDGDCIARPNFVSNHRILAQQGYYVAGNRVLLSQPYSQRLLVEQQDISPKWLSFWLIQRLRKRINRWHTLFTFNLNSRFRYKNITAWKKAKGCNMAFWHQNLLDVSGFEEKISGWGYEDSDLMIRLINKGVKRKSGYFATTVLHLWHKEADRSQEPNNLKLLNEIKNSQRTKAKQSLLQEENR
ncbi:glycosyltransferase family 2 protein [Fastidiosibacter lacustris]|uniref:glycosyltransferase family 2 protein n=1 Tax=Fastidiosibacter lacustris TaxID=2056695 RepID=UPI0018656BD7|nr:glycosyltransferase family 2 protein [Fastidiosibacter lacustris]